MRRLFIMRKDLHMSPGKLAAQVAHCAEGYWTRLIREQAEQAADGNYNVCVSLPKDVFEQYVMGSFVKTICEAKNKAKLLKAKEKAIALGLTEGRDFGLIYDNCLAELQPEEEDGTTLTGIWFAPLPDEISREISKSYHLYM